jgi:aminoglycoside phosphotransferase (APT) family kinase protein
VPGRPWTERQEQATLGDVTTMLTGLGRAIASWHRLDRRALPVHLRRVRSDVEEALQPDRLTAAAEAAVRALGAPHKRVSDWLRELEPVTALAPVLVHGDVNEGQVMLDDDLALTGILDWETAHVGHPLKDFDFGEWGFGIFAWEPRFGELRSSLWESYRVARGAELPSWRAVHLACTLMDAHTFIDRPNREAWARRRLANCLELLSRM